LERAKGCYPGYRPGPLNSLEMQGFPNLQAMVSPAGDPTL
jgi:hypothetical protein